MALADRLVPGDARDRRRRDVVAAARPGRGDRPARRRWPPGCSGSATRAPGWWPRRPGRAEAARSLDGAFGLALRTQRPLLVGWAVGLFALGAVYGSLTQGVEDLARSNPTLEEFFRAAGQGSLVDSFLATMLLVLALLAGAYAVGLGAAADLRGDLRPARAAARHRAVARPLDAGHAGDDRAGQRGGAPRRRGWASGRRTRCRRRTRPSCSGSPAWSWSTSRPSWCPPASSPWWTAGVRAGRGSPGWCWPCGSCSATSAGCSTRPTGWCGPRRSRAPRLSRSTPCRSARRSSIALVVAVLLVAGVRVLGAPSAATPPPLTT